jgi:hypothetical protein
MRFSHSVTIPLPPDEAFDFVVQPENWSRFFSTVRSAEVLDGWGAPGGRARIESTRGETRDLEVIEWDRPRRFRYLLHTPGRPDADNLREFVPVPGGTRLTGSTNVAVRRGVAGAADLAAVVVGRRVFRRGIDRLPRQALAARGRS